ncbi:hypothetical protein HDU91_001531 [Kappamyces sp. JEL0680]|nr:hypothetical protein HDU91_001531 [Kappamyces sp. JEL0680]
MGVPVYYSYGADNDDTLASYAHRDNASILSADQDYYRYKNTNFTIYDQFMYKKGLVKLHKGSENSKRDIKKRPLINPPLTISHSPDLADIDFGFYRKGPATSILKWKECPHLTARPIRQALYARMQLTAPIKEIFPVWNELENRVEWTQDLVAPDPALDMYLDAPHRVFVELEAWKQQLRRPVGTAISDRKWESHLFACTAVVYNLSAMANRNKWSLLDLLLPIATTFQSQPLPPEKMICCRTCKSSFGMTKPQLEWYDTKKLHLPKRCPSCISSCVAP